ncbi:thioredoxin-like protein [Parasitella parasitica]|nr:thioredoxin-like protein [Parasitella parasitica]
MVRLLTIATTAILAAIAQAKNLNDVDPNTVTTFKDGAFIVEYYSPSCKHCTSFESTWDQLVKDHQNTATFARLNCAAHKSFCSEMGISRIPTLQSNFNGGEWKQYIGDFSADTVDKFIRESRIKRNEHGKNVELTTSAQLKTIIGSKEPWFVKFYAPWCTHCKHLAPIWESLAKKLQGKVNVAEVNCEDNKALCQEYKIAGLPTLNYFVHEATLKYTGERKLEKLLDYAIEMSGSPVHNIDTDSELDSLLKASDVNFVYVRDAKKDEHQLPLLEKFALAFIEHIPFFTTTDHKTALRYNLKESDLPAAIIVKDGNFHVFHDADIQNIVPWIHKERYPLVTRILPHNSNRILKGKQVVVLGITKPDDSDSELKLREMAKIYRDEHSGKDITFALLDGELWGNYVNRAFGIHSHKLPTIIVLDPKKEMYYDSHGNKAKFAFDKPEEILKSIKNLDKLAGVSTAASKAMNALDKFFISFSNHWILWTTVLFGALTCVFWILVRDEPRSITPAEIRAQAKKEIDQRNQEKKMQKVEQEVNKTEETTSIAEKKDD